jgi:hypothetical protein
MMTFSIQQALAEFFGGSGAGYGGTVLVSGPITNGVDDSVDTTTDGGYVDTEGETATDETGNTYHIDAQGNLWQVISSSSTTDGGYVDVEWESITDEDGYTSYIDPQGHLWEYNDDGLFYSYTRPDWWDAYVPTKPGTTSGAWETVTTGTGSYVIDPRGNIWGINDQGAIVPLSNPNAGEIWVSNYNGDIVRVNVVPFLANGPDMELDSSEDWPGGPVQEPEYIDIYVNPDWAYDAEWPLNVWDEQPHIRAFRAVWPTGIVPGDIRWDPNPWDWDHLGDLGTSPQYEGLRKALIVIQSDAGSILIIPTTFGTTGNDVVGPEQCRLIRRQLHSRVRGQYPIARMNP